MAAKKDNRLSIPELGEYYDDLLTIDSWINGRTRAMQANSLLGSKLQEREPRIEKRIEYLANKRGISAEEMRILILTGKAKKMTNDELELSNDEDEG